MPGNPARIICTIEEYKQKKMIKKILKASFFRFYDSFSYRMMNKLFRNQWKRNLVMNQIDPSQKAEGEEEYIRFWQKAFGSKKVDVYSYRLFSHYMGNVPHIIPEILGYSLLEKQLNPIRYRDFYSDKNVYSMYFPDSKVIPQTLMARIVGGQIVRYNDKKKYNELVFSFKNLSNLSAGALAAQLEGYSKVCFKPTVDTSSGLGVTLFLRQENQFLASDGTKLDGQYLEQMGNDWVIQEVIQQHPYISQFNTSSTNTLRVCVYRSLMDEQPRVTAAAMRVGAEGAFVDNAHAGGRFVGIDVQTGALHHTTLDQYGTRKDVWNNVDYSKNDFQIPCWQQVKDMAVSIAHHTPHMRLIAFDICLDSSSSPRVIEMNVGGFSWWMLLYIGQDVFAGETAKVIDYCLEMQKKNPSHIF